MEFFGHFKYNGTQSEQYGLILANVSTKSNQLISGEINTLGMFNKRSIKTYYTGDDYSDSPLSFDVEIISERDEPLDLSEQREVMKWLFYQPGYRKLYITDMDDEDYENVEIIDGNLKYLYVNCRFTNPSRIEGAGGVIGYKATMETDSGFAWQDAIVKTYTINAASTSTSSTITINVDTDINDYTYPKLTIKMGSSGGNLQITNQTDSNSRITTFHSLSVNAQVIMMPEIGYVSGQNYYKFYDRNFVRLVDGANILTIIGNIASITVEWQNRRYL